MARRAQHLRCSLSEGSERADNKLDKLSARSLFSHREQCIEDAARDGPCAHGNFAGTSGALVAAREGLWSVVSGQSNPSKTRVAGFKLKYNTTLAYDLSWSNMLPAYPLVCLNSNSLLF